MSCSSGGKPEDGHEPSSFEKLKAHAKEFIEATPEEHVQ